MKVTKLKWVLRLKELEAAIDAHTKGNNITRCKMRIQEYKELLNSLPVEEKEGVYLAYVPRRYE